jgi:hypothetical protein
MLCDAELVFEAAFVPVYELIEPQLSGENGGVHGYSLWDIEV